MFRIVIFCFALMGGANAIHVLLCRERRCPWRVVLNTSGDNLQNQSMSMTPFIDAVHSTASIIQMCRLRANILCPFMQRNCFSFYKYIYIYIYWYVFLCVIFLVSLACTTHAHKRTNAREQTHSSTDTSIAKSQLHSQELMAF